MAAAPRRIDLHCHSDASNKTGEAVLNALHCPESYSKPDEVYAQAQLRGMGLFNGKGMQITGQHCMTAAEVAVNDFSAAQLKDKTCKIVSQKVSGGSMEADLVCSGNLDGKGHMKFVFDSDTHYTGQMTMSGIHEGKPLTSEESFEGHWVKADCGGIKT